VLWYLHALDPIGVQKSETTSRRQIQKNHREGGSSAELVARDAIEPPNKQRNFKDIKHKTIPKTIPKSFSLPANSTILTPEKTSRNYAQIFFLFKNSGSSGAIDAFSSNRLILNENSSNFTHTTRWYTEVPSGAFSLCIQLKKPANGKPQAGIYRLDSRQSLGYQLIDSETLFALSKGFTLCMISRKSAVMLDNCGTLLNTLNQIANRHQAPPLCLVRLFCGIFAP
jgi:hypothetical protein